MIAFGGYHMGDYFNHWLAVGKKVKRPPRIFQVNWIRKDAKGKFVWPGFGENMRVLSWIVGRCQGQTHAVETLLGWMPEFEDLHWKGLEFGADKYASVANIDRAACGTRYACEQEGVAPDIICIGKGMGAGYQPIGAMLASAGIYNAVVRGSGFSQHGHTYTGYAAACAGALAVQRAIENRGLLAQVRERGAGLEARLRARFGAHPHVGEIRGRGLFWALELVEDRASKRPFDPKRRISARPMLGALENGLMCYSMGGALDGVSGDHVMLAPPYIISEAQLDEMVDKLTRSIDEVIAQD